MKLSSRMKWVLRLLFTLLGAGVGLALAMGGVQLMRIVNPIVSLPMGSVMLAYACCIGLGALLCFAVSGRVVEWAEKWSLLVARRLERMTLGQLAGYVVGLIVGLLVAALLSQILHFLGDSMFTATMACLMYLVLGAAGVTLGHTREKDMTRILNHGLHGQRFSRSRLQHVLKPQTPVKLLDTSALLDGRLIEVCRTGFLEGEMLVPGFVLNELRTIADAADPMKRARGRRGLELLEKLRESGAPVRTDDTSSDGETDEQLLRLAKKLNAAIITGDQSLMRAARLAGLRALNLNELAGAMRPVVHAGDELTLIIAKEGKEQTQGVGYMDDGTMVVVEGGRQHVGETLTVVVTSALQTNAGRMVFAKIKA